MYYLHRSGGSCQVRLSGSNIVTAVESGYNTISREAGLTGIGHRLVRVRAYRHDGILGGKGGTVIEITARPELRLNRGHGEPRTYKAWLSGPDHVATEWAIGDDGKLHAAAVSEDTTR